MLQWGEQERERPSVRNLPPIDRSAPATGAVKLELLVIVSQRVTVNTHPGLVLTARQALGVA